GPHSEANAIRSAVSTDGLTWTVEPGARLQSPGSNFAAPRVLFLDDGRVRLYSLERGRGIVSAISLDHGLTFEPEAGIRVAPGTSSDRLVAFAPEIVRVADAGFVMYYAGYETPQRASIHRAVSDDGLEWKKVERPVIAPSGVGWDAAKCSEMCLVPSLNADQDNVGIRMLYEACDGTAPDKRGVWRIASATSARLGR
ncbi:MAG: exo-alpha-sialidase, partial [Planctomycetaceae bacterium]|nr:exo-alpha-sialidase [Planctomycetaceae bacterium]